MKDDKLQEILHFLNSNIDLLDVKPVSINFDIIKIKNCGYWIDIYYLTKNNNDLLVTKIITKEEFKLFQQLLIQYAKQ